MKDKELLDQLNNLKAIKPDSQWKERNRSVLMNQIYGAKADKEAPSFNLFQSFLKTLPKFAFDLAGQPAMVVVFILFFVFGGSVLSVNYARDTKPGDSLYIAKLISERTKEALTFSDKEKAQLVIKHAQNRADELHQAMEDPDYDDEKVGKLADNAQKEIAKARERLEKISPSNSLGVEDIQDEEAEDTSEEIVNEANEAEDPQMVFSVNSGKDENGMEVVEVQDEDADADIAAEEDSALATTSEEQLVADQAEGDASASDILEEAGALLTGDDYDATLDKLSEAQVAIEKSIIKEGPASSTDVVIEEDAEESVASSTEE